MRLKTLSIEQVCDRLSSVTPFTRMELSKMSITEVKILCKKFLEKELTFVLKGEEGYSVDEVLDKYFNAPLPSPLSVGGCDKPIKTWDLDLNQETIDKFQMDTSHVNDLQQKMAQDLANQTDEIIRKAINKYLGHDKWTLEEMVGRGWMHTVNNVDYLYVDGTLILELYPYESHFDIIRPEDTSYTTNMTRGYRIYV